ncbi:MAG: enoyl-CoA hydratase [Alphaproteobacteria bacterium]|nr:MAG: enoyl-CoA hydratase [Alphaproteobacteria bacterium]
MTNYHNILVTRRGSAVWVTLNRPQAMNSLTLELMNELDRALREAEADTSVRALVITGAGTVFCAGADIKAMGGTEDHVAMIRKFMTVANPVLAAIETSRLPVIAAVQGSALAGGLELLLCCDIVIADQTARIGDMHVNLGLVPGGGSSVRLTRRIGPSRAKQVLFTGSVFPPEELEAMGLVTITVAQGKLEEAVDDFVKKLDGKSPLALGCMKQMVLNAQTMNYHDSLRLESEMCLDHAGSDDAKEGLAAFAERRQPRF